MSGQLNHNPAHIIADLMSDLGIGDLPDASPVIPTGWTIFPLQMQESPDQAIQVKDTPGRPHRRTQVDGVIGGHYGIQLLARSAQDVSTPYIKLKKIMETFDETVNRDLVVLADIDDGITNYTYRVNAVTATSLAVPAGNDGRRFLYAANFLASIELVSTGTGT